jgi:hypothetical protein
MSPTADDACVSDDDRETADEPGDDGEARAYVGVTGQPLSYRFANRRTASEIARSRAGDSLGRQADWRVRRGGAQNDIEGDE